MLQLQFQTSSSNMIPITDFKYIYELARCSKCTAFVLLKSTNALYGFDGDCCCIHEIQVPFQVNTDLIFRTDTIAKDLINRYDNFFIPDKFNWVILPEYYWPMYAGGDIETVFSDGIYILIDKTTKQPIEQFHMYKALPNNDFMYITLISQLTNFFLRVQTLNPIPETFGGMQDDPIIRKIYDGKAVMGRSLVHLKNDNMDVAFYLYKGLFTLNKADILNIDIRFDMLDSNTFMASFRPIKKRNPMSRDDYGVPFQEVIHCMFVNIAK